MNFYLATSLESCVRAEIVANHLTQAGHEATYSWWLHGAVGHAGEGRLIQVAQLELAGVRDADLVIVVLPGGRGTHAELGMALALDKPVIVHSPTGSEFRANDDTCAFYWHPNVHGMRGELGFPRHRDLLVHQAEVVLEEHRAGRHGRGAYGHAAAIAAKLAKVVLP
jgi:hypothetical protein